MSDDGDFAPGVAGGLLRGSGDHGLYTASGRERSIEAAAEDLPFVVSRIQ